MGQYRFKISQDSTKNNNMGIHALADVKAS